VFDSLSKEEQELILRLNKKVKERAKNPEAHKPSQSIRTVEELHERMAKIPFNSGDKNPKKVLARTRIKAFATSMNSVLSSMKLPEMPELTNLCKCGETSCGDDCSCAASKKPCEYGCGCSEECVNRPGKLNDEKSESPSLGKLGSSVNLTAVVNSDGELLVGGETIGLQKKLALHGARWDVREKHWIFPPDLQEAAMKFLNLSSLPVRRVRVTMVIADGAKSSRDADAEESGKKKQHQQLPKKVKKQQLPSKKSKKRKIEDDVDETEPGIEKGKEAVTGKEKQDDGDEDDE